MVGEPLSIGGKSRVVPTAIAHAVRARDNHCCTLPGCQNKRYLHCHHVERWSNGGETSIDKDYRDRWCFIRPDGIAVADSGDYSRQAPPAGGILSELENHVSESPPPAYWH